ncbi:MAG: TlpA disulfide reductase family protein [Pseudomonadota bacterium]
MDQKPQRSSLFGPRPLLIAAGAAALAGLAAVYLTETPTDNGGDTPSAAVTASKAGEAATAGAEPVKTTEGGTRLNSGEMKAFVFKSEPMAMPEVTFVDGEGAPLDLASFKGKAILLNLWATWCAPCRHEMPALDRLDGKLGGESFEVVALSLDRAGLVASQEFLDEIEVKNLKTYADPTTKASAPLKVIGMPTTILIDAEGREIGRLIGPAEWDSDDAVKLISSVIDEPKT